MECPLCRSQYDCWSATSIETSVYDVIDVYLECSCTAYMVTVQGAFFIMWEHLKHYFNCRNTLSRTHCYMDGLAPC